MQSELELQNQRRVGRARTILGAEAVVAGLPAVPCQVKDLSDTGARITVEEPVSLPDRFEFRVPRKGLSFQARVRWRHEGALGIEFLDPPKPADELDPATRIRKLETENAELRRRLADLTERLYAYGASVKTDAY